MAQRSLGISVYPEHTTVEKNEAYLELAAKYGFSRIFTCLLSVDKGAEETVEEFRSLMRMAHELGFRVAVDTNEQVFERLGATPGNLKPFVDMGVDIIRLDGHFGDLGDMMLTRNDCGISIEFNASGNLPLDLLIERGSDPRNMCVCHNFYPEPYTGISEEIFMRLSRKYKDMGLHSAAFVSSQQPETFGPWPVAFGLPTCEDDRNRSIDLQARHLVACGLIDDILIGNAFASEEELAALAAVDLTRVSMKIELAEGVSEPELHALWDFDHVTRGDASEYLLRSSLPRMDFRETSVPARETGKDHFTRGDVMVVNDNMAHYRGELEVALKDIPCDGARNLVGTIPSQELFLLDYIAPEHPFKFIEE